MSRQDAPAVDLAVLQRWMFAACTGAVSPGPATGVVRASGGMRVEDRLAIYARGYLARLIECLRAEFPTLRLLVGDDVFDLFAKGYVLARPPASHSMFDLGAGFADHLEETRPRPLAAPGSHDALPAALARLERARLEASRARGVETDPEHAPADPIIVMTTPALTARTPESLRLLHLDFWLADALAAADRGDRPARPESRETYYAVARSRYCVRAHVLAPWQHVFLTACGRLGAPVEAAVSASAKATALDRDQVWASLVAWLPLAVDAGMVTVPPGGREA